MQLRDSDIQSAAFQPVFGANGAKGVQTEAYAVKETAIYVAKQKNAEIQTQVVAEIVPAWDAADITKHEYALQLLAKFYEETPLAVELAGSDFAYNKNQCSLIKAVDDCPDDCVIAYNSGRVLVFGALHCSVIAPFYVQQRAFQVSAFPLKNISRVTAVNYPVTGHENGSLTLESGQVLHSFAVSAIIYIYRAADLVIAFDRIGRIVVYYNGELINALILREKKSKRENEEGNLLASACVLNVKVNIVTAATAMQDGSVSVFSFICRRSVAVEQIMQLTDMTACGYRQLAQFSVVPGNVKVYLLDIYQDSPRFMQTCLKTCCLVRNGANELKLYCSGHEICGYYVQAAGDFYYVQGSVVVLDGGNLLCCSCYTGAQIVQPYACFPLDRIYSRCESIGVGDKSTCFLSNSYECEVREISLRSHVLSGDRIYREVSSV